MDDRKLEELLKVAKVQSNNYFSNWKLEPSIDEIMNKASKGKWSKRCSLTAAGAALICAFLALWIMHKPVFSPFAGKNSGERPFAPVAKQTITLDDSKPVQLVDFIPVNRPDHGERSLMAILWGAGSDGGYKILYSSLLSDSDWPYPVSTIDFPGSSRLALISSQDRKQRYLHYRLIGYSGQDIETYIEEDYVPGGKLGIRDGMLIEQRAAGDGAKGEAGSEKMVITFIIPYQIDDKGELLLPTDHVQLNVGEQLLLTGLDTESEIQFTSGGNSIKRVDEKEKGKITSIKFSAFSPGEDYLLITPDSDISKEKSLYIKVVE